MRIVAGSHRGRVIASPKGHRTHPMGERVRTALFNTLGDIQYLTVLDPFGGSGAVSIEAISRGAKKAVILDVDKDASKVITENISKLDLNDRIENLNINARSWLIKNPNPVFDIIICDPPYDQLQENLMERLAELAKINGVIVYSLPPHADLRLDKEKYVLLAHKSFGDATLAFYRKIS